MVIQRTAATGGKYLGSELAVSDADHQIIFVKMFDD
jgi:hypothetical protein